MGSRDGWGKRPSFQSQSLTGLAEDFAGMLGGYRRRAEPLASRTSAYTGGFHLNRKLTVVAACTIALAACGGPEVDKTNASAARSPKPSRMPTEPA